MDLFLARSNKIIIKVCLNRNTEIQIALFTAELMLFAYLYLNRHDLSEAVW